MKIRTRILCFFLCVPAILWAQPQEVIDAYELNSAIQSKNVEKVKELIKSKSNVNFQYNGRNALHTACNVGNPEIAKLVIDAGVEVNSISEEGAGRTALQMVCGRIDPTHVPALVELLLQSGANPELAKNPDQFPVFECIGRGHVKALKALLEHGASTEIMNSMNQDPPDYADYLIDRGISDEGMKARLKEIQSLLK